MNKICEKCIFTCKQTIKVIACPKRVPIPRGHRMVKKRV